MRSKSKRDDQITLRVAGTLRAALEDEAATESRGLSSLVRKVLLDHAARRAVLRETAAANQERTGE
jgi:predicted HicB family RNase H-like nuclease